MRKHALQIFRAALDAANPYAAVLRHLKFDGRTLTAGGRGYRIAGFERVFDRIYVIGAGKASAAMARGVEHLLGTRIAGGIVNVPDGTKTRLRQIELLPAGHPIPDERGVKGARRILEIAQAAGPRDLLICLISGGASALLPAPRGPLAEKQAITGQLLRSGADIHELNTVRKHLSAIKGGQLAAAASPARVLALIFSDVIGDDLDVIGSGPTVADPSTVRDADAVLRKYDVPLSGAILEETPKPGDRRFAKVQNLIVGSNRIAIDAAARKAKELGYRTLVLSTSIEGETREIARMHAAIAREIAEAGRPARRPACVLSGGETTVTVRGNGLGGRNQEFVLAAAIALEGRVEATIFSAGTDGLDGPTDAAGAIADARTLAQARQLQLDPSKFLDDNDSYRFFEKLGALVKTGPTGTNVMDVRILLVSGR